MDWLERMNGATGYEHRPDAPELEKCWRTSEGYRAEVWIPIMHKKTGMWK